MQKSDLIAAAALAAGVSLFAATAAAVTPAERAVLYYFDGLHPDAIERLELPTLQRLQGQCTSVEQAVMTFPWHPTTGGYGQMHTTSLPNPITMTGNLFLRPNQPMLQHQFGRATDTAIATGSKAYDTLTSGFDIAHVVDVSDAVMTDAILDTLERYDPKFLRIQLQDVGRAGYRTINASIRAEALEPWHADIWHPDSPYAETAREADRQLGRFIAAMEANGRWDSAIFVFMADGQSQHGWHLPMDEDSWHTPMILCGPGVRAGHSIPYAEIIDVVPTLAAALGVEPPNPGPGAGRVLHEAFVDGPEAPPEVPRRMLRFNEQNRDYLLLTAELRLLSVTDPRADHILMQERNARTRNDPGPFLGITQIDRWHEAGSFNELLARNEAVIDYLRERLAHLKSVPYSTERTN